MKEKGKIIGRKMLRVVGRPQCFRISLVKGAK